MRLINLFIKDVKSFFRDIRSFFLLFITPIMLVIIIGISFVSSSPANIKIAVCAVGSNDMGDYIESSLKSSNIFISDISQMNSIEDCRQYIRQQILFSSYRAGVIITPKSEYQITKVEIIVDNSKLVSEYIKSYFTILTNDMSQKITKGYVDVLFTNIDEVRSNITEVESRLQSEKQQLENIKQSLQGIRSRLNPRR